VILYIYSTCWHMKSVFYEHQHNSSKMERKILGLGKNLFWELVPGVEVTLVSKFHSIWSNIAQESNFGMKGVDFGKKNLLPRLPTGLYLALSDFVRKSRTLSNMDV
jgi:hypothetical protein